MADVLQIETPRWAKPLLTPSRYKGAHGGRGSGKSHFFAEAAVENMVANPEWSIACIREIQKSLKFSAKRLIESKIEEMGLSSYFDIIQTEIRRVGGDGIMIFQGMQDHTADSIKSLEDFDAAWVEEAQSLSAKSLRLLRPTIRKEGSEIWFSWNPEQPEDPVDDLFRCNGSNPSPPDDSIVVQTNYYDNPFLPETLRKEMESDRRRMDPETFRHIWEGGYNTKSDAIIFSGHYTIEEFDPQPHWDGPYHGLDFGFANDPTAAVKVWISDNRLFVEREAGAVGLELDNTAKYLSNRIEDIEKHVVRADNARPESISYLKRKGMPKIEACEKWSGSVEDGIEHLKSYDDIVIHPRCEKVKQEMRLYQYKVDKQTGDVMPKIVDANNHYIDALRYSLGPLIKKPKRAGTLF